MRANEIAELSAFVCIAEEGSFRKAATRLNLSPSTLSHSIRLLEERLGVTLLHRTTRRVVLSDAGAALFADVGPALESIRSGVDKINAFRTKPRGSLRLTVPHIGATMVLLPRLSDFAQSYPDVALEVMLDNGFVDIIKEGYDAGIRMGESIDGNMSAVRVNSNLRGAVVASPEYWSAHPPPTSPRDLQRHNCINRRFSSGGGLHRWEFNRGGERATVALEGQFTFNDDEMMRRVAIQGLGVAMLSEYEVAGDLRAGRLVRVLEDWCPVEEPLFLYYPRTRSTSPALQALIAVFAEQPLSR